MNPSRKHRALPLWLAAALLWLPGSALAAIDGVHGPNFELWAGTEHISTADGNSVLVWGFGTSPDTIQYPGPTLLLHHMQVVTVTLHNDLPFPVSIVFPGHQVTATGAPGPITAEAPAGGTATYTFTAAEPGTYQYFSGTRPELQVEMGLFGAIVVRPMGFDPMAPRAYDSPDSAYDREYLFLLSEMDPNIHETVEFGGPEALAGTELLSDHFPNYWFINGRTAPDTMLPARAPWLPSQPYNSMPRMHPGEKLLMRVVTAGRDLHPFHHHGNHARVIARNGRLLTSGEPGAGADLSYEVFTVTGIPGETADAVFEWTGWGLGWDVYGHSPTDAMIAGEDPAAHGKPIPVSFPETQELAFGAHWSGSPFLGQLEQLPPGQGGLNPNGGYVYMWHSHTEKEMTNWDIFPGGMMTMLVVEPPGVPIDEGGGH